MSIIYDALKKVEESSARDSGTKITKGLKSIPKIYFVYALVVCLGFFIANIFFKILPQPVSTKPTIVAKNPVPLDKKQDITTSQSAQETQTPQATSSLPDETRVEPQKVSPLAFVLNGVFFSGDEGYALINNQIVKKGDKVKGATVKQITLEEVDLEWEGSLIKLSNSPR